jgi:probable phosphoglycerate mutase
VAERAEIIGAASATVAEYRALLAGLECARELGVERVEARSDARLVVADLLGERSPRNPVLAALRDEIRELAATLEAVIFTWIPSDANTDAHALVTAALARRDDRPRAAEPGDRRSASG